MCLFIPEDSRLKDTKWYFQDPPGWRRRVFFSCLFFFPSPIPSVSHFPFLPLSLLSILSSHPLSFFFLVLLTAVPVAYGSSQAKGRIGAAAAAYATATATQDLSGIYDLQLMAMLGP